MAYVKATDFAAKDSLLTGNPAKIVKGTEIDTEFTAIQAADAQNVKGPTSVTADTLALFDSTTGKLLKASSKTLPTGDIVGTSDSQTLTNKTLAAATNTIEARSGPDSSAFSFRNKIIGGDFTTNPWQRGTSFVGAAASNVYTADRWTNSGNASNNYTISKAVDSPTAAQAGVFTQHSLSVACTTTFTPTSAQSVALWQQLEGYNVANLGMGQAGTRYFTVSFWVKATKTGACSVGIRNYAGDRAASVAYTINASNTWEYKTCTFQTCTDGTWNYDNTCGMILNFMLSAGATYSTSNGSWSNGYNIGTTVNHLDNTSNVFKIALVQLEAGSVATPFESRPYGVELALCQRYYEKQSTASSGIIVSGGYQQNGTAAQFSFPIVPKRGSPNVTKSGAGTLQIVYTGGSGQTVTLGAVSGFADKPVVSAQVAAASSLTTPSSAYLYAAGGQVDIEFEKEL